MSYANELLKVAEGAEQTYEVDEKEEIEDEVIDEETKNLVEVNNQDSDEANEVAKKFIEQHNTEVSKRVVEFGTPSDKVSEVNIIKLDNSKSFESIDLDSKNDVAPFELEKEDYPSAVCEIPSTELSSSDIELVGISRYIKEVAGYKLFPYKGRIILASENLFESDSKKKIIKAIEENLKRGKLSNLSVVREFKKYGEEFAEFIISYGDVQEIVSYFRKFSPKFKRIVTESGEVLDYVISVGL